jgi:uncharacterized circularly permuted ATP-grasp superfamily protein
MFQEINSISMLAPRTDDCRFPDRSDVTTVKLPAIKALTVQQSGTCGAAPGCGLSAVSGPEKLFGRSDAQSRNALSFNQWAMISCGIRQRMEAVSACLDDVFRRSVVPQLPGENALVFRMLNGVADQIGGITRNSIAWGWLASTDLHVADDGQIMVMDHNLSVPSGLQRLTSLVNRSHTESVNAINDLGRRLNDSTLSYPGSTDASTTVVLDPCRYNPTFSENEFLARTTGAQITRASDLVVSRDGVESVTGSGRTRIQTIVRRIDDDLLDPNCFRPDSLVGLPGLCAAWKNGRVNLVNPPGSSVASIRSFTQLVPAMIRNYLGEEPALPIAETQECSASLAMQRLYEDPTQFAVRTNDPMHPARPYLGNSATKAETLLMLNSVRRNPEKFVIRNLLPKAEASGFNLRVFSTMGNGFYMPRCGIGRKCQSDGGATLAINDDESAFFVS